MRAETRKQKTVSRRQNILRLLPAACRLLLNALRFLPTAYCLLPSALCLLSLLLTGCASISGTERDSRANNEIRLAYINDVSTLDPVNAGDAYSFMLIDCLFDGLVGFDGKMQVIPRIAEQWEVSDDQRNFVFHLRKGVRFHNGREVTATDVKYSIERLLAARSGYAEYYSAIVGAREIIAGKERGAAPGIIARDRYTVEFRLVEPQALFLSVMAMPPASIVPREEVERWGEDFSFHPVGSGPFRFVQWLRDQRIVIQRNDDYFQPDSKRVSRVIIAVGYGKQLQTMKLERGELDAIFELSPPVYRAMIEDPYWKSRVKTKPSLALRILTMNTEMPPFDRRAVRQAVCYAINRERLCLLLNNLPRPARGIIPQGLPGFDPDTRGYQHDPERARALLREAGFENGFETELIFSAAPISTRVAEAIQRDLAGVGITVKMRPLAYATLIEIQSRRGGAAMSLNSWAPSYPDPDDFLYPLFSSRSISDTGSLNWSFYSNPEFDKLVERGRIVSPGQERDSLYRRAEQILLEDAPAAFLFWEADAVVGAPGLLGYEPYHSWPFDLRAIHWER